MSPGHVEYRQSGTVHGEETFPGSICALSSLQDPGIAQLSTGEKIDRGRRVAALVLSHNAAPIARPLSQCHCGADTPSAGDRRRRQRQQSADSAQVHFHRSACQSESFDPRSIWDLPAGGPLRFAISSRSDLSDAWIMDDDIVPEPECLGTLLMARDEDPSRTFRCTRVDST